MISFFKYVDYIHTYIEDDRDLCNCMQVCKTWRQDLMEEKIDIVKGPKVDWGKNNDKILISSCKWGHENFVSFLLKIPLVNPSALNNEPLKLSIIHDHINITHQLLNCNNVFISNIYEIIHLCIENERHKHLSLILDRYENNIKPLIENAKKCILLSLEYGSFLGLFQKFSEIYVGLFEEKFLFKVITRALEKERFKILFYLLDKFDVGGQICQSEELKILFFNKILTRKHIEKFHKNRKIIEENFGRVGDDDDFLLQKLVQSTIEVDDLENYKQFSRKKHHDVDIRFSVTTDSISIFKFLFEGVSKNLTFYQHHQYFSQALSSSSEKIVLYFLSINRTDPSFNDNYPIRITCKKGNVNILKALMKEDGVSVYCQNNKPIRSACENNHTEIVETLLNSENKKIDISVDDHYCLYQSIKNNNLKLFKILFRRDKDFDIEKCFETIFPTLASRGEIYQFLVEEMGRGRVMELVKKFRLGENFCQKIILSGRGGELLGGCDVEFLSKNISTLLDKLQLKLKRDDFCKFVKFGNELSEVVVFCQRSNIPIFEKLKPILAYLKRGNRIITLEIIFNSVDDQSLRVEIARFFIQSEMRGDVVMEECLSRNIEIFFRENRNTLPRSFTQLVRRWRGLLI